MTLFYEPLCIEIYEFRMLTILPGEPDDNLACTLENQSLLDLTNYAALSYCWGDPNFTNNITINDVEMPVTINLAEALRQLRRMGVAQVWVDALCINQSDRQEKSLQIRNMKHIYSKANIVYAWVGGAVGGSETLSPFLGSVTGPDYVPLEQLRHEEAPSETPSCTPSLLQPADEKSSNISSDQDQRSSDTSVASCQHCEMKSNFANLKLFLDRPYWKRLWIIQEITVSSHVAVLCGNTELGLSGLQSAAELCQRSPFWTDDIETSYFYLERILEIRRLYRTQRIPLCKAIVLGQRSFATNPQDKVFALLGICFDGSDLVPTPNYKQSLESIMKGLSKAMIRRNNCLDSILINGIQGTVAPSLPSWIPNWSSAELPSDAFSYATKELSSAEQLFPDARLVEKDILRV